MKNCKCEICGINAPCNAYRLKRNKHHFCSRKCYYKGQFRRVVFDCDNCGTPAFHKLSHYKRVRHHFCSHKCWSDYTLGSGVGSINRLGYRMMSIGNKTVSEHRIIMEKMLGRKLRKGETVHHRNGKRADNRPENLELFVGAHGPGQRVRDLKAYLKTVPKRLGGLK